MCNVLFFYAIFILLSTFTYISSLYEWQQSITIKSGINLKHYFNQHIKDENAHSRVSGCSGENLYANNFVNGLFWGGMVGGRRAELALVREALENAV